MGKWAYSFTILGLGSRWIVARFKPQSLYRQEKKTRYTLNKKTAWPQSRRYMNRYQSVLTSIDKFYLNLSQVDKQKEDFWMN
jgi:hypothetical protein